MSDELVKRLRGSCSCNIDTSPCMAEDDCRINIEAADRIEELEAGLKRIIKEDQHQDENQYWKTRDGYWAGIARTALAELTEEDRG